MKKGKKLLGEILRTERKKQSYSQDRLALVTEKMKDVRSVSLRTIQRIESGETKPDRVTKKTLNARRFESCSSEYNITLFICK